MVVQLIKCWIETMLTESTKVTCKRRTVQLSLTTVFFSFLPFFLFEQLHRHDTNLDQTSKLHVADIAKLFKHLCFKLQIGLHRAPASLLSKRKLNSASHMTNIFEQLMK